MSEALGQTVRARTSDVPERERFDYFRDALTAVYCGVRTEWEGEGSFDATFDSYRLGDDLLGHMWSPGHLGRRGADLIRRTPDHAVYLNLGTSGPHVVHHLDRDWALPAGAPVLLDSESPFVVDFQANRRFRLFSLRIQKDETFAPDRGGVLAMNRRLATTAAGRALGIQTRLMCAEIAAGRREVAAAMAVPVRALLATLLHSDERPPARLDELKSLARARLGEPCLRADEVGAALGIGARTVQLEFQRAGETFAAWLRTERLELARDRLGDPAWRARTVAAIAVSVGFADPTHFHRAFRARFGDAPGAFRGR